MLAGNLRWGASESFPGDVCKTQVVTLLVIYFLQVTQLLEKTKWWRLHLNFRYLKINKRSSGVTRYGVEKTANKSPGHTTTGPWASSLASHPPFISHTSIFHIVFSPPSITSTFSHSQLLSSLPNPPNHFNLSQWLPSPSLPRLLLLRPPRPPLPRPRLLPRSVRVPIWCRSCFCN